MPAMSASMRLMASMEATFNSAIRGRGIEGKFPSAETYPLAGIRLINRCSGGEMVSSLVYAAAKPPVLVLAGGTLLQCAPLLIVRARISSPTAECNVASGLAEQ